jgi:hypothetical protein
MIETLRSSARKTNLLVAGMNTMGGRAAGPIQQDLAAVEWVAISAVQEKDSVLPISCLRHQPGTQPPEITASGIR